MSDWNSIETIPRDRKVLVKTATGLERVGKVSRGYTARNGRIHCWRADGRSGDLQAVAWKEMEQKFTVHYVYPPIPTRAFDYCATYDGDEPNDNGNMATGWGKTKDEAIADLLDNYPR